MSKPSNHRLLKEFASSFLSSTRAKLRAYDEEFDWLSSYHLRCFYANYEGDLDQLELGFLKSTLLLKVCSAFLAFLSVFLSLHAGL